MKLVVLGMHRSGASVLTRLLGLMGVYCVPLAVSRHARELSPGDLATSNDPGSLNEALLESAAFEWNRISTFDSDKLLSLDTEQFNTKARALLDSLNSHPHWVISDPGLCLLLPLWKSLIPDCVCIYIYRNPIEVARSLQALTGTPVSVGIALWENYTRLALNASRGQASFFVSHQNLMTQPETVAREMLLQLSDTVGEKLTMPSEHDMQALVDLSLYRHRANDGDCPQFLNSQQLRLFRGMAEHSLGQEILSQSLSQGGRQVLEDFEREAATVYAEGIGASAGPGGAAKELGHSNEYEAIKRQFSALQRDIGSLDGIMERLVRGVTAMSGSNSWKIGCKIVSAKERLLGRKRAPSAIHYVNDAISDYESWSRRREGEEAESLLTSDGSENSFPFRPILQRFPAVDVLVCVHNALEDVTHCLHSIIENTPQEFTLYIVNDGSDRETSAYLREFQSSHPGTVLLENERAGGYTKAANKGLRKCSSEYVVCLNSDAVVPRLWLSSIIECGESDPSIGIVGPLSNAASWQSVPERFDENGDWKVNELCSGFDVNQMAELVYQISEKRFPNVDFVNGFCFAIKRGVIDAIGYLDEEAFPEGYGEENDYCLRAAEAGFRLAIADQAYVYHAKSRSYSHDKRRVLSRKGSAALVKKHGAARVDGGVEGLKINEDLKKSRALVRRCMQDGVLRQSRQHSSMRILYVVSYGLDDLAVSTIREVVGMRSSGVRASVAFHEQYREEFLTAYPGLGREDKTFLFFGDEGELGAVSFAFDVIIATSWSAFALIEKVVQENSEILPAYFIHGDEPWLIEDDCDVGYGPHQSLDRLRNVCLFAESDGLCRALAMDHGLQVGRVYTGLDDEIYYPSLARATHDKAVNLCFMVSNSATLDILKTSFGVLKAIKARDPDAVQVVAFGVGKELFRELQRACAAGAELDFEFEYRAVVSCEEMTALLRNADIYIGIAGHYAGARVGLQAMACGCSVILPDNCGSEEYAIDQINSITIDSSSGHALEQALVRLIGNRDARLRLQSKAQITAARFSVERASLSRLSLFRSALTEREIRRYRGRERIAISAENPLRVAVWPCVMRLSSEPTGSAYIRLLEPLGSESIAPKVQLIVVHSLEQLRCQAVDVCIIQRNVIRSESTANDLFEYCQREQIKIVLELDDDLFHLEKKERALLDREELRTLKEVAVRSDAIVTSTPSLRHLLGALNANVFCVRNALSENLWWRDRVKPEASGYRPIRVLYMGTRTHGQDLEMIREAWARIEEKYAGRVVLDVIGGGSGGDVVFGNTIAIPPGLGYPEFVRWLKGQGPWDIGLIPLRNTAFNRKKSPIKFLDYSALNLAIVCSDMAAYRDVAVDGENALVVTDCSDEWYGAMEKLIEDEALRLQLGNNAFALLRGKYSLERRAGEWLNMLDNAVNG